jgi:hypothetical protein
VEAKLNDKYNSIRNATYGIAFFGTPHRGGNHAKLGDIVARVWGGVVREPRNDFMEALKKRFTIFQRTNSGLSVVAGRLLRTERL